MKRDYELFFRCANANTEEQPMKCGKSCPYYKLVEVDESIPVKPDVVIGDKGYWCGCDYVRIGEDAARYIKELEAHKEKYRWHDLRVNSEDLPKEGSTVMCQHLPGIEKEHSKLVVFHKFVKGQFVYNWDMDTDFNSETFGMRYYGDVIAWKYLDIEPFEDEALAYTE